MVSADDMNQSCTLAFILIWELCPATCFFSKPHQTLFTGLLKSYYSLGTLDSVTVNLILLSHYKTVADNTLKLDTEQLLYSSQGVYLYIYHQCILNMEEMIPFGWFFFHTYKIFDCDLSFEHNWPGFLRATA